MISINKTQRAGFTGFTIAIFLIVSVYLVVPLVDVPIMGLSISAPLMFVVAMEAIFRPPRPWSNSYRPYIILALLIWAGVFLSVSVNGLISGGVDINTEGILTVIRYAYWLLIFIVVIYVVNVGNLYLILTRILGWSVLVLALSRWGEAVIYGNIGAWTGTHLFAENIYGLQFSAFSPFLLGLALSEKGWKKIIATGGYILLLGAVAINGSRGSWVAVAVGIIVLMMIFIITRLHSFLGLLILLVLTLSVASFLFSASPIITQAVEDRYSTLQRLDDEKSYVMRKLMNQKSLRLFETSPFFGVGAGRFRVSSVELQIPRILQYASQEHFDTKSSHNSYLGFLAENGLVGSIPFVILLSYLVIAGLKAAIYFLRQNQFWGAIIFTSFVGLSVHIWVISAFTSTSTWFIYGLVAAMIVRTPPVSKVEIK